MKKQALWVIATVALLAAAGPIGSATAGSKVGNAQSTGPAEQSLGVKRPIDVSLKISGWCDNTGSDINLIGDITLAGTAHRVTLANNLKGSHTVTAVGQSDVTISGNEGDLLAMKPPAFGGVGGNPHAVASISDTAGNVVGTYYLGRCVTGARGSTAPFSADITEHFTVAGGISTYTVGVECSSARSQLDVKATDWADGVNATLLLVSQVQKDIGEPGVHWDEAAVQATATLGLLDGVAKPGKGWWIYEDGTRVHGPGGNPLVYDLVPLTDPSTWDPKNSATWGTGLGRCNKLLAG